VEPADLHASLYLEDAAGNVWTEVGHPIVNALTMPTSFWTLGQWADDVATVARPAYLQPGVYRVVLTVTDADGRQLGAVDGDGAFRGVRMSLGSVEIAPPITPEGEVGCVGGRSLTAADLLICLPEAPAEAVPSGSTLTLAVIWSAANRPDGDYAVRWRLTDSGGNVMLEEIEPVASFRTSRWRAGDSFEARYSLRVDPAAPPSEYDLTLDVLTPEGSTVWTESHFVASVEVLARDRQFELPSVIEYPLDLSLGDAVRLRGFDIDREGTGAAAGGGPLGPGDTVDLVLYWQADGPTDLDYTVFAHFVGPDGRPHGQVDQFPGDGNAPTTSWAPGQVIEDALALPIAADAPLGTYRVAVGMYHSATGTRLPVSTASGRMLADNQFILPVTFSVVGGEW
jgi:hypothetical protein